MKKLEVILNCDTKNEIDDQFAIAYALKSPELKVDGVISVQNRLKSGKNSVDIYHREAKKILKLSNSSVPVFKGSRQPLQSVKKPEISKGVKFIIESALKTKKKIVLICTGPATDLANALLLEPRIKNKCKILWLSGFKNRYYQKIFRNYETNLNADLKASKVIFNSGVDLTMIPAWGVADRMLINSQNWARKLKKRNLKITKYLAHLLETNSERFGGVFPKIINKYWILFDVAAVAVAKNLGILKKRKKGPTTIIEKIDNKKILRQVEEFLLK